MQIRFTLNSEQQEINAPPLMPAASVLRDICGMRGIHPGCGKGQCGGCLILDEATPLYSCQIPAFDLIDRRITTIEGFTQMPQFPIIVKGLKQAGVILCEFCAPGRVLSLGSLFMHGWNPDPSEIREHLKIVRCTCVGPETLEMGIQIALEEHYARTRR